MRQQIKHQRLQYKKKWHFSKSICQAYRKSISVTTGISVTIGESWTEEEETPKTLALDENQEYLDQIQNPQIHRHPQKDPTSPRWSGLPPPWSDWSPSPRFLLPYSPKSFLITDSNRTSDQKNNKKMNPKIGISPEQKKQQTLDDGRRESEIVWSIYKKLNFEIFSF